MASLIDRIKEILIRDQLVSQYDLEQAINIQKQKGGSLSKILSDLNLINEDVLANVLSESLGLPQINILKMTIDPKVIHLIRKDLATQLKIMPISIMGDHLTLAMADPLNILAIDNVKTLTGFTINPIIVTKRDIEECIEKYYSEQKVEEEAGNETFDEIIKDIQDVEDLELIKDSSLDSKDSQIENLTDEAPIIKLTDTIIQQSVIAGASDVFIEPLEKMLRVRYRIDGVIREIDKMPKVLLFPMVSRIKVISNLDISEHRLPQDGRFKTLISQDKEVDFRVNVLPTALGEKVVLRVLDKSSSVLNLDSLGFHPTSLARLKECAIKPHGMILSCGPTGSGKTTTLYSILKYVDSPEKNIVTVEDPVEYQVKGISQVNIKPQVGLTFSASLRSILRQDPDIIMIGEIRDAETLDIAVKAALTGHLVLTSLHTTTAAGSIVRMMNMGVEPFLICSSVLCIIAQRLLRKICIVCKEKYTLAEPVAVKVGLRKIIPEGDIELYRGKGCKTCLNSGYKGRVGITELLVLSPEIKHAILNREGEIQIKKIGQKNSMITMREDSLHKAIDGLTSLEEVLRLTAPDD